MSFNFFKNEDFHTPNAEINTTPLVDVMLVLMVIFLVTAPVLENAVNLSLPKANIASTPETKMLTISVTKDGKYYVNSAEISKSHLLIKLEELKGSNVEDQILIRADSDVKYENVAFILTNASKLGLGGVSFAVGKDN